MIGKLRNRLALQAPIFTETTNNGMVKTWGTQFSLWGNLRAVTGSEQPIGEGETTLTNWEVTIRYRNDINTEMRFVYDNRFLNIKAVLDKVGLKKYLTCLCQESRND